MKHMRLLLAALIAALGLSLANAALAQGSQKPLPVDQAFRLTTESTPGGDTILRWKIADGYYLYRDLFRAETTDGVGLTLSLPRGVIKDDPNFGSTEIFHDAVELRLTSGTGPVTLTWQGCMEDSICYPPVSRSIDAGSIGEVENNATAAGPHRAGAVTQTGTGQAELTLAKDAGLLDGLAQRGGSALVVLGFLGFGLLLAFTPCVFPMFPIVLGMIAGQGRQMRAGRGFTLTLFYVLAMAGAFALLGVVAAWSGQNLQMALQSPLAIGIAAGIFVLLALSMFGLFELQMPRVLQQRLAGTNPRSGTIGGAALLGVTSALIVGPCVTAPLAGALLYIAQTGDVALGAMALFALGLGQGIPLLVLGTFGARVLPRSGPWLERSKQAFGIMFLGFAIWLAGRVLPGQAVLALCSALLIGTGSALLGVPRVSGLSRLALPVGAILLFAGSVQGIGAALGGGDPLRPLGALADQTGGDADATPEQFIRVAGADTLNAALSGVTGPSLIYVTADWCTTCRSIERGPLADPEVQEAMGRLTAIKLDVTDFGDASRSALDMLGAAGPPTMVFLDPDRAEPAGTRIVGDTDSAQMLDSLARVTR